jgi:selenocysteine lyase/cysteine desulfurase
MGGEASAWIPRIRESVIGDDVLLDGPFGPRRMVYADATASGRALGLVEDVIREQVLPMYGNTHTEASATGRCTTGWREQARGIIHDAVNGGDDDVVVFCGSGATAAIDRLIRVLELDPAQRPVVFIGPYEHHSNELPWRESPAEVVTIGHDEQGRVDLGHLALQLARYADRPAKIGSFSAASNVTGIITDVDEVAILPHRHGALALFDYAAAGPYLPIDMNPAAPWGQGAPAYKDAVFISPHKFPGGPGTPGVLVAKRASCCGAPWPRRTSLARPPTSAPDSGGDDERQRRRRRDRPGPRRRGGVLHRLGVARRHARGLPRREALTWAALQWIEFPLFLWLYRRIRPKPRRDAPDAGA